MQDFELIMINSVRKTDRVVMVGEDYERYGLTGEIAAIVAHQAFDNLDAPVKQVAIEMVPTPFGSPLEDRVLPSDQKIQTTVKETVIG